MRTFIAILALGLAFPTLTRAALTWSNTTISGASKPLQKTIDVAFPFRNTGNTPVTIRDVQTNCDCLVAGADQKIYLPGQAGLVVARFAVGERTGAYERRITVTTDDSPAHAQHLLVHIEVPELASLSNKVREWSVGSAPAEQAVDIVVTDSIRIDFTNTLVSANTFRARLETVEAGRRYRVHISPVNTAETASVAVRVIGTAETGERIVVSAYANVR